MPPKSPQHGYNPNKKRTKEDIPAWKDIKYVITSKGSVYVLRPDGKIVRWKTAEKKWQEPQDILVFIPSYDDLVSRFGKDQVLKKLKVKSERQYNQLLLDYLHMKVLTMYIIDKDGNILTNNFDISQKLENNERIYLALINKLSGTPKIDHTIPVTNVPRLGYYTFDMTIQKDPNTSGSTLVRRHVGHPVVHVVKED